MRLTYIRTHTHRTDEDGARVYTPPARFETILYVYIYVRWCKGSARRAFAHSLAHVLLVCPRWDANWHAAVRRSPRQSRAKKGAGVLRRGAAAAAATPAAALGPEERERERDSRMGGTTPILKRERERASAGHPTSSAVLGPRVLWYNTRSAAREWGDVKVEREGQVERSSCSLSFRASEHGARRAEQGEKKGAERAIGERPRERGVKRILARSPPGYTYTLLVSIFSSAGILMARELARLYLLWLACSDRYTPFRFSLAPGLGKFVGCCALRACSSREDERRHEGSKVLAERDNGSASVRIVVVLCALMWRLCGYRRSLRIF